MPVASIKDSVTSYERWLRQQLGGELVEKDITRKHEKMAQSAFSFMRATYWRWSETIFDVCPELSSGQTVLAVGDIHLENFGSWRDVDGRLIWGVNDFDEAAEMPYTLDLVRLAASAMLARDGASTDTICRSILGGYRKGLRAPRPFVLERDHDWLRKLVTASDAERSKFWEKLAANKNSGPPPRYRRPLLSAMPGSGATVVYCKRSAGVGSLGRPRWVAIATYRGGEVIREAKALVPSAWSLFHGRRTTKIFCNEIGSGQYRSPDPWYHASNGILVRRLSPNNRKIEVEDGPDTLLSAQVLEAMGFEIANIHLGTANIRSAIVRDLGKRKPNWLHAAAKGAATAVADDHKAWKKA